MFRRSRKSLSKFPTLEHFTRQLIPTDSLPFSTSWTGIRDNIHEPPLGQSRPALSANIRHALPLCFQSQNELTRKEQLFHIYDADPRQQGHKFQALQDTLPYFLGAVDDDYVRKREELRRFRNDCARVNGDSRRWRPSVVMVCPRPLAYWPKLVT